MTDDVTADDGQSDPTDVDRFLPRLVHELRSPSHSLSCYLDLFRDASQGIALPAEAQEALTVLGNSTEELRHFLRSLSRYAHAFDPKQCRSLPVQAHVERMWEKACQTLGTQGELHCSLGDTTLIGDDFAFGFALLSLFENALKFRSPQRAPRVEVKGLQTGDRTLLTVSDNGIGIDPRFHTKCLQPFERLHPRREYSGAGLGLPTAVACIEHMCGKLSFESDGESGTTVHLAFEQPEAWRRLALE